MKKSEQLEINEYVSKKYEEFDELYWTELKHHYKQLRHCNAWVHETESFIYLVSYSTIVAFIDKRTYEMFDILRLVYGYTSTSAQHIAKFRNDYRDWFCGWYTWREL